MDYYLNLQCHIPNFFFFFFEKEIATHSSILAWRIPWTKEPGGLQFMGPQRVRHNWVTKTHTHTHTHTHTPSTYDMLSSRIFKWADIFSPKWKSLSTVNPIDCSLPGSSVHGILQARILEWVFPTQGLNPGLLHYREILYQLSYQGRWSVKMKSRTSLYLWHPHLTTHM